MQFNKKILLLGAGFSANFGGLLARDMWVKMFNNPLLDGAGDVKLELKKQFNFENAYSNFYTQKEEKKEQFAVLEKVIQEAYQNMNDKLLSPNWSTVDVNPSSLTEFINMFVNDGSGGFGACFSLNQDLFFEKHSNRQPLVPKSMEYAGTPGNINANDFKTEKILPSTGELEEYKAQFEKQKFGFIKLHGSLNWKTQDGSNAKVIGINKPEIIKTIPLLNWYRELFAAAVAQENIKLVVYGYSFRDDYINKIIYEALHGTSERKGSNMKIYIISTENQERFHERLIKDYPLEGQEIWQAVDGYFPYPMKVILPGNAVPTREYEEIVKKIN